MTAAAPNTIDADQRRVLFRLASERLARADLVYLALANGKAAEAESGAIELGQDLALMHEIGWDTHDRRESFEIALAPADLIETLQRYAEDAERSIFRVGVTYGFDNADAASVARCAQVCRNLIGALDDRDGPGLTIGAAERDELHWLLTASLFGRAASEESVEAFMQDMRLMIGLGWLDRGQMEALDWPEARLEGFDLALPADELESALRRLAVLARAGIESERAEQETRGLVERRTRFARAARLCEELLNQIESK